MEQLKKLNLMTVHSIETVRKYADQGKPGETFNRMVNALKAADDYRNQVREYLKRLLN